MENLGTGFSSKHELWLTMHPRLGRTLAVARLLLSPDDFAIAHSLGTPLIAPRSNNDYPVKGSNNDYPVDAKVCPFKKARAVASTQEFICNK